MHIQEKELCSFTNNSLNTEEMIAFLEHLDTCDFCLEQMIQKETSNTIQAPAYLKDQILRKAASPEIQATKAAVSASNRMKLFYHGLQTAFGIIAALFLLFCSGNIELTAENPATAIEREFSQDDDLPEHKSHLYDFTRSIGNGISKGAGALTGYLNEFSNKIINGGK